MGDKLMEQFPSREAWLQCPVSVDDTSTLLSYQDYNSGDRQMVDNEKFETMTMLTFRGFNAM